MSRPYDSACCAGSNLVATLHEAGGAQSERAGLPAQSCYSHTYRVGTMDKLWLNWG